MSRDQHQPMSTQSHIAVGMLYRLEMQRRILGNKFGAIPKPLSDDCFNMSGYCLDAHELLPAGSTRFHRFGPEEEDWIAEPTTSERAAFGEPVQGADSQGGGNADQA